MKKIWILVLVSGLATLVLISISYKYLQYLNHHPISMKHPCPRLTKKIPFLKEMDRFLVATSGICWYKTKELKTGKFYFVYSYNSKGKILVLDCEKREKWEELTTTEFLTRFDNLDHGLTDKDLREIISRQ